MKVSSAARDILLLGRGLALHETMRMERAEADERASSIRPRLSSMYDGSRNREGGW